MIENQQQVWDDFLSSLKKECSEQTYELWFKPMKLVSIEDGLMNISVPNKFFSNWIQEHYTEKTEIIIKRITGKDIKIILSIDPQATKLIPEEGELEPAPPTGPASGAVLEKNEFYPKYTFENFIVGPSNHFAHAAAEAVANAPGEAYNPLFIYGGVGLGKTHLLHAIGQRIKKEKPHMSLLYITSEKFMNEFIESLRKDRMIEFQAKYRSVDGLFVDDVQFFGGKEGMQDAFFHLFNTLYGAHKQVVLSSDCAPKEISNLVERLRSRLQWGVIADIQPPDLETRVAILRKKAEAEKFFVPDDVIFFLAGEIKSNIRDMEGCLNRIVANSELAGTEITVDRPKEILKDTISREETASTITIDSIQKVVAKHFNLESSDMKAKRRTGSVAFPRQVAMYLSRTMTESSTTEIGESFGGRDHTTVLYACEKIKTKLSHDPYFNALLNKISQEIKTSG